MKQLLKILSLFIFILIICFSTIYFINNFKNKSTCVDVDPKLDKAISTVLENYNKNFFDGMIFESHKIYGVEDERNKLNVYLTSFISIFEVNENTIEEKYITCMPACVTLNKRDFSFLNYKAASDGPIDEAIKNVILPKYIREAKNYSKDYNKLLMKNREKSKMINKNQKQYKFQWENKDFIIREF